MQHSYNYWLVALSFGVAVLASYTALDVSTRISLLGCSRHRWIWLTAGAVAMGAGIWSMHFIGMLAFSLAIPLGYDVAITGYSLAIAIGASFFALCLITYGALNSIYLSLGGVLLGVAIAAMHYTGMAAMQMHPSIRYNIPWFITSVILAVAAATVAVWIAASLNLQGQRHVLVKRICASTMLGGAIAGMHYAGMAASNFPIGSICGAANGIFMNWLAVTVTCLTLAVLLITLILSNSSTNTTSLLHSLASLNGEVVKLATLDPLTELPNRQTLAMRLHRAIERSESTKQKFALLSIDLDRFKYVNDSLGRAEGDAVLKAVATRLRDCVRGSDTVSRLGGDEFAVLLAELTDQRDVEERVILLLARMQDDLTVGKNAIRVTPSIGVALYPEDGCTLDTLLKSADAAMWEAKQAGRNGYRFFEASMNETVERAADTQRAIREALEQGYLHLVFQPKFYGATGYLSGAEALVRLTHPIFGVIAPDEFIPIAEHCGLIVQLGEWVMGETCRQLRRWELEGLPDINVAVNLSAIQLNLPDLVSSLRAIASAEGVVPERIIFEITETVAMRDVQKSIRTIGALQEIGFGISIDDFGTGYSSFAYLQQFRAKQLKIDRFFTQNLDASSDEGQLIVSAIISLAHALKMEVVAEGVESETQLRQLVRMGCDQLQGFLLGKPLRADDFSRLPHGIDWQTFAL